MIDDGAVVIFCFGRNWERRTEHKGGKEVAKSLLQTHEANIVLGMYLDAAASCRICLNQS